MFSLSTRDLLIYYCLEITIDNKNKERNAQQTSDRQFEILSELFMSKPYLKTQFLCPFEWLYMISDHPFRRDEQKYDKTKILEFRLFNLDVFYVASRCVSYH